MGRAGGVVTPVTDDELLATFDDQIRRGTRAEPGRTVVERTPLDVVYQTGVAPEGWHAVIWSRLTPETADEAIAESVAHFTAAGAPEFEWKTYSYDTPEDLPERLAAAGFAAEEPETLMIAEIDVLASMPGDLPDGVVLRRVRTEADVELTVRVGHLAFGSGSQGLRERLLAQLRDDPEELWCWVAMAGETPVCSARMELHEGTDFASLWGGGTVEEWRGKGIYRALVKERARIAAGMGVRFVQVDASPMSRPILERLGFRGVAMTTPYVYVL
jgi:hypothetical protein